MSGSKNSSIITTKGSSNRAAFLFALWILLSDVSIALAKEPLRASNIEDDFVVREVMIPMRDGVRLYAVVVSPKQQGNSLPILLNRTPYGATRVLGGPASSKMDVAIGAAHLGNNYIYVSQDTRGRFQSEGEYVMYRPPIGPFNKSDTDESTDAWDTVDWLIENIDSNGNVGIWGTSYAGWLTLAALRNPHPAVAAAVAMNPAVDGWKADDWFHWGAFRGVNAFSFIYSMETNTGAFKDFPFPKNELYDWVLQAGAIGSAFENRLDDRHEMWSRIVQNPSYGPAWKSIAADQWFDSPSRLVPTLHVHSFWDQEDIYGSPAAYAAMEKHDTENDKNYFVGGPWYHGQQFSDGDRIGNIQFDEATAKRFRVNLLRPFLEQFLHGRSGNVLAPATVFESGSNRWRHLRAWPPAGKKTRLFLHSQGTLSLSPPIEQVSSTRYISDPAKPVPFAPRPLWPLNFNLTETVEAWQRWLTEDQRFVDGRPDVLTWVSEPLTEAMVIRGAVMAHLFAETTGTDADWIVKLIDVYPDPSPDFAMSGYQLMISGEIFRGRYREDIERPQPVAANTMLEYTIPMPQVNHSFQPGHRLMIQVQSSWFPLYDRNPQIYVENIMYAPRESYTSQQQRIHHSKTGSSFIEIHVDADASD